MGAMTMRTWGIGLWAGEGGPPGSPQRPPVPDPRSIGHSEGSRVLVVDDDPGILATISEILAAEGLDVTAVETGAEAVARVRERRPSLVLLDMRMPGMDGWAVARALHQDAPGLPIVVMTAAENAAAWAAEVAADAYLAKPFQLDDLLRVVERFRGGGSRPN